MPADAPHPHQEDHTEDLMHRAAQAVATGVTFVFLCAALLVSSTLLIYNAYSHNLKGGLFALIFSTLSAQITLGWLLWKANNQQNPKN